MKAAILNGILGSFLSIIAGFEILMLGWDDLCLCLIASNLAGLIALLSTLQIEKLSWFKKIKLQSTFKTWSLLIFIFSSLVLVLAPPLRQLENFAILILPLVLSTGFSLLAFGPIQDSLVRRQQRKERALTSALPKNPSWAGTRN
jgi:putative effector of murein hydrolase LrgA (UPF0299 family)